MKMSGIAPFRWMLLLCQYFLSLMDYRGDGFEFELWTHTPDLGHKYVLHGWAMILPGFCFFLSIHILMCMDVLTSSSALLCAWLLQRSGRGYWLLWSWSYRCLWSTMWVLRMKPGSSERVASVHSQWDPSPPAVLLLNKMFLCSVSQGSSYFSKYSFKSLQFYLYIYSKTEI